MKAVKEELFKSKDAVEKIAKNFEKLSEQHGGVPTTLGSKLLKQDCPQEQLLVVYLSSVHMAYLVRVVLCRQ